MGAAFIPLKSFDWQAAVAGSDLDWRVKLAALVVPHRTGRGGGLSGRHVRPDPAYIAASLGVSERTAERYLTMLRAARYLRRTATPSAGNPAEFTLMGPPEYDRWATTRPTRSGVDVADVRPTRTSVIVADVPETTPDTDERDRGGRSGDDARQNEGGTPDTDERDRGGRKQQEVSISPQPTSTNVDATPGTDGQGWGDDEIREVLDALATYAGERVDGCRDAAIGCLARGWSPRRLVDALRNGRGLIGAVSKQAVLRKQLDELTEPPPAPLPWCGNCHEDTRMVEIDEDGTPAHCPTCNANHPSRRQAS